MIWRENALFSETPISSPNRDGMWWIWSQQFLKIYILPLHPSPWGRGHANFSRQHESRWWEQRIVMATDVGRSERKATPKKTHEKTLEVGELSCFWAPNVFFWWKFKLSSFLDYFDFQFYSSINKFWSRYGFTFTQMCFDIQTVLRRLKDGWHPKT